jgi:hypothetical protein
VCRTAVTMVISMADSVSSPEIEITGYMIVRCFDFMYYGIVITVLTHIARNARRRQFQRRIATTFTKLHDIHHFLSHVI